ncbi:hypothetical protein COU57_06475 [Candidatus Pacearchaeota archaeon CG10_big_fil_rev_8_21_14_0_10_32_14]|nr:MAG: hypothetical protein COU57_06475 [Candidatus Pacearchaeota archaeon CG10_big_fil_rev_8_21_14_0_10_32_14]
MPFNNSSIGLLMGIIIGALFGYVLEKKLNPHPIKLTQIQKRQKLVMAIIVFIIALLLAVFLAFIF